MLFDDGQIVVLAIAGLALVAAASAPCFWKKASKDSRFAAVTLPLVVGAVLAFSGFLFAVDHANGVNSTHQTTQAKQQLTAQGFHVNSLSVSDEQAIVSQNGCQLTFDLENINGTTYHLYIIHDDGSKTIVTAPELQSLDKSMLCNRTS